MTIGYMLRRYRDTAAMVILKPINPAWLLIFGLFFVVWGVWVASPFWDVSATADIFLQLRGVGEHWWGGAAILAGVLMTHGAVTPSYPSLSVGAAGAGIFWCFISITLWASDWQNTGGLTYGFISVLCALTYLNVKVNHDLGHDWTGRGAEEHA